MHRALILHPTSRCAAASRIDVDASRSRAGLLALRYSIGGKISSIRMPPHASPARADNLWQRTCFEAFVRVGDDPGYVEFNFSPSGEWAAYRFTRWREGMANLEIPQPPRIETVATESRYTAHVELRLDLPPSPWCLALTAVIEEADATKSYWALAHPPGKPDFHHADGFALDLT